MAFGCILWGHRTLVTVGDKILLLTADDAFTSQIGCSITILFASAFGLPISTSHTNIGAMLGLGLAKRTAGEH